MKAKIIIIVLTGIFSLTIYGNVNAETRKRIEINRVQIGDDSVRRVSPLEPLEAGTTPYTPPVSPVYKVPSEGVSPVYKAVTDDSLYPVYKSSTVEEVVPVYRAASEEELVPVYKAVDQSEVVPVYSVEKQQVTQEAPVQETLPESGSAGLVMLSLGITTLLFIYKYWKTSVNKYRESYFV